jgi:O-antigen/teichoic acid export membrane protein
MSAAAVSAAWMVIAARALSLSDFADLALLSAVAVISVQLSDLGLTVRLPTAVARDPRSARGLVRAAMLRRAPFAFAAGGATAVAYWVAAQNPQPILAAAFALSVIATCAHQLLAASLRALERFGPEALGEPGSRVVVLALGAIAARTSAPMAGIGIAYALADLATLGLLASALMRSTPPQPPEPAVELGCGGGLAISVPLGTAYWRLDAWLLGMVSTDRQLARYAAPYRLLDAALLPAMALSSAMISRAAVVPRAELLSVTAAAIRRCVATVLPFAVAAPVLGRAALGLLFGDRYESAGPVLAVLSIAALPSAAALVLTSVLATRDPRGYSVAVGGAVAINTSANLLVLPRHGAMGAAAVTLGCQVLFAGGMWWRLRTVGRPQSADPDADTADPRTLLAPIG